MTDNRLEEIRARDAAKYQNVRMGEPLTEPCPGCGCVTFAAARNDVSMLLQLLDARPAVAADARELVEQWRQDVWEYDPRERNDELIHRITAYANQQVQQAAIHEAATWRAFILNNPRFAETWATFGKPEDLSADDVSTLIDTYANQRGEERYKEGVEAAAKIADGCNYHKDDCKQCVQATTIAMLIRALLAESGKQK